MSKQNRNLCKKVFNVLSFPFLVGLSLTPVVLTTIACAGSTNVNSEAEKDKTDPNNNGQSVNDGKNEGAAMIENADQFFPKINPSDYYKLVDFENHEPIINDDFRLQLIKDVISRVASSQGEISFNVEEVSPKHNIFHFKWTYGDKVLYKNYTVNFEIT